MAKASPLTSSRFVEVSHDRRNKDVMLTIDWRLVSNSFNDPYGATLFMPPEALVEYSDALHEWVQTNLKTPKEY